MMFAIITVALISGAVSDRMKFGGWLLFAFGWFTLVYVPVAHWVWGGGFIGAKIHALDFAGGTAVHINAGAAALGLALVLGKRIGWPRESMQAAQRAVRRARRRPAVVRLVRLQRRLRADRRRHHRGRVRQHPGRHGRRPARLDHRGVDPRRQADPGRRLLRRGRRSGRHHPGLWLHRPAAGGAARPRRRCGLRPGGRPEVQARLRRLARRRRRPLRRRMDRLAVHRLLRHPPGQLRITDPGPGRQRGPVLRRRRRPSSAGSSLGSGTSRSTPSRSRALLALVIKARTVCGSTREAEVAGIDVAEHARERVRPHARRRAAAAAARSPWPGSAPEVAGDRRADGRADVSEKVAG